MKDEYWGTFSIYDHRDPVFRKSLVLFDRVVIPVPDKPIYDITQQELEELSATTDFLVKNDAAIRYPWSSAAFQEWEKDLIREALSITPRDQLFDSRLHLQQQAVTQKPAGVDEVIAVPVYGVRDGYDAALTTIAQNPQQLLTLELAQHLTVPTADVPLQDLIELRLQPDFQAAFDAMRRWQTQVLPEALSEKTASKVHAAAKDFERMINRYEQAMADARFSKQRACVISLLALGGALATAVAGGAAITVLATAAPALYALKEADKSGWRSVQDRDFAPAGVICEANAVFERYAR